MIFLNLRRRLPLLRPHGVLSYQSIKAVRPINPIVERTVHKQSGLTYGLGPCSYDIRTAQGIEVRPGGAYLVAAIEEINLPDDICAVVQDKSTWARRFLVVQNTHIDPGFFGSGLTLELTYHGFDKFFIAAGTPIAQLKFEWLDEPTRRPYTGKYTKQPVGLPTPARFEKGKTNA